MITKPLPIGIDNFEMLVSRDYYFLDKTNLIKDLLDKKGMVNLFTRPRRFGKTLNISMLQYFFEDMRGFDGEKRTIPISLTDWISCRQVRNILPIWDSIR